MFKYTLKGYDNRANSFSRILKNKVSIASYLLPLEKKKQILIICPITSTILAAWHTSRATESKTKAFMRLSFRLKAMDSKN